MANQSLESIEDVIKLAIYTKNIKYVTEVIPITHISIKYLAQQIIIYRSLT